MKKVAQKMATLDLKTKESSTFFAEKVGEEEAVNTDYMKKAGKSEVNVKPRPADPLPVFENNFVGGVLKKVAEEGGIDNVIGNIRTGLMLVGDQDLGILFTENFIKPTSCVGCNITPLITTTALYRIFMRVSPYFKNEELVAVDKFCCMGFEVNSALAKMIKVFNPEMMGKMYRQELDGINPKGKEIRGLLQHDDNTVGMTAYLLIQQTLFDDKNNNSKKKTLKNAKRVPCEHKGELDPEATKSFPLNQKFVNLVRTQMEASNAPEVVNLTKKSIQKVKDNVLGRRFRTKIVQALGHKGVEAGIYGIVASLERGIQQETFWASQDCCIGKKLGDTITLLLNYPLVQQGDAFRRELLLTRLYFEEKFPNFDRLLEEDRELLAAVMSCVVKKLLCDGNDSSDGINCLHPHPEYIVDPELFDKVLQTIKQCGGSSKLLHNPLKTSKNIRKMIAEHNDVMERGLKCQMDNVGKTFNEFWEALIRGNFEKMVTNFNRNIVRSPTDDSTTSLLRKAAYLLVKETEVGGFQNWDELFSITQRFDALSVTVPIAKILLIDIETLGTMYRKCLRGLNVKNEEICGVLKTPDHILGRFAVVVMYYLLFPEEANKSKAVLPEVSGKIQPLSLDREFYNEVEKMVEQQPEQYKESLRKKMELITDETLGRRFRTHIAELAAKNMAENVIMKSLVLLDPFFKLPEAYSKRGPCCFGRALRSILKIMLSLRFRDVMLSLNRNYDLPGCICSTVPHRHMEGAVDHYSDFSGMATVYMLDKMLFKSPIPTDGSTGRHEIAPDEENDIFKQALITIGKEEKLTTVLHNPKESQKRLKDIIKSEVEERWGPVDLNLDEVEIRFSELVFKLSKSEFRALATYFKVSLLNVNECVKSTTTILKKAMLDVFFESEDMDFHIPYTREECAGFDAHFFGYTVGDSIFKMILMECDDVGESFRRSLKKFVGNDPRIESLLKKCGDYLGIFFFVLIDMLILCDLDGSGEDDSLIKKILYPKVPGTFEELERKAVASPPRLIASSMRKVLAFNQKDQSLVAENFKDIIFGTMRLLTPELEGLSDDEIAQIKDKKLARYLKDFIQTIHSMHTNGTGSVVKLAISTIRNLHLTLRLQIPALNAYWTTVLFLSIKTLIFDRDVVDTL
uniref:RING-type domain-containing protein n=2 Tax=Bursaphelenchus xylophilus TaxID=6326 RepID=A0A1I7RLL7_BURXY